MNTLKNAPFTKIFINEDLTKLSVDQLLDQEDSCYDDNWIVSAGDLFGKADWSGDLFEQLEGQAA